MPTHLSRCKFLTGAAVVLAAVASSALPGFARADGEREAGKCR